MTILKLNWGHKLVFFAASFMLFVMFLVYKISTQKIDLVDKNYYERGVQYQEEINKFKDATIIQPSIYYYAGQQMIQLAVNTNELSGEAFFYRAGNAALDFKIPFQVNQGKFNYSTAQLPRGLWKVTFEWRINDKLMASEKQFTIE